MALVINTNMFALNAQKALNKTQNNLGTTIQRLSTGLRINSAKDDAAGMSIANGMTSNIMGMKQATRNANDGISLAQTAEGSLSQVNDNLQAIRNLAVQASNGTNSNKDIATLQAEVTQRIEEIGRIINQAEFNGNKTLDTNGTIMLQTGANHGEQIAVNVTATTIATLDIKDIDLNVFAAGASSGSAATMQYNSTAATAAGLDADLTFTGNTATNALDAANVTITNAGASGLTVGNALSSGYELHQKLDNTTGNAVADQYVLKTTAGDVYEVTLAADASGADKEVGITVGTKINTSHAGTVGTALPGGQGTGQGAGSVTPDQVFAKLDKALDDVSAKRSQWGAIQSRLESAVENLTNTVNNLSAARSRILDADFAEEVSNLSNAQILQQAGTTVLAMANQSNQSVLSLLR
ncbi:flagellin [Candidatus Arsenophonus nilaparvatae]|uniref:flagellin N-terminal helical domain-containing protein n=1 Tax=Candidatus Arsenophonus nilaparvatae TaxID=1247023 RepID=UPI000509EFD9|nr:flagellin [Candidatus Arsenophonus nilaparvatae]